MNAMPRPVFKDIRHFRPSEVRGLNEVSEIMDSFDKLEGNDQAEMICLACRKLVGPPCKSWRGGRELHNRVPRPSRPTTGDVFSDSDLNFD